MDQIRPALSYRGGSIAPWRTQLRMKLRELLGVDSLQPTPLAPRALWTRSFDWGAVEKIAFSVEPGADVVGYWCTPRDVPPPWPTVICLQGHQPGMHLSIGVSAADEQSPLEVEGDRDFALRAVSEGFAALCIEQRAFGQRREAEQSVRSQFNGCLDGAMQALMLGRTLAGERVYDVMRAIDYLQQRDDVRHDRIGLMGNSGGGTITTYAAALDERIAFAMPSCAVATYRGSIMAIHHCPDNFIPGLLRYAESGDVAGLIAPRPLVVVAGEQDEIFPIDAVREAFGQIQAIYESAGATEWCQLIVGDGGHRFYADRAWPALKRLLGSSRE